MRLSIRKWTPCHVRDRICRFPDRNNVETEKRHLRHPANDRRKYLCHHRSHHRGRAHRYPDVCLHGVLLPEADLQTPEDRHRTAGRHPFGCLWFLRTGGTGAHHPRSGTLPGIWRKWQQHADRLFVAGHDDSAHHHRIDGIFLKSRAAAIL